MNAIGEIELEAIAAIRLGIAYDEDGRDRGTELEAIVLRVLTRHGQQGVYDLLTLLVRLGANAFSACARVNGQTPREFVDEFEAIELFEHAGD